MSGPENLDRVKSDFIIRSNPLEQEFMNKPQEISMAEWKEIIQLPAVREDWGLDGNATPEDFADMVYGVKFHFTPGMMPGYMGDLYILHGDALGEPMTLIRRDGQLVVV